MQQEQSLDVNKWVYDIETLKSYFSAAFINVATREIRIFEVYDVEDGSKNEFIELIEFLKKDCKALIGYNNLGFDYPILHDLLVEESKLSKLNPAKLISVIYDKAQKIIDRQKGDKKIYFDEKKCIIPQLDLMKMNYYDSKVRMVSLKQLEAAMRFPNVQDMPYNHDVVITSVKQAKEIADYNINDIEATLAFYLTDNNQKAIALRRSMVKEYGNLYNKSDTDLAKEVFAKRLCKAMNITREELNQMRTYREKINFDKEVILPQIKFETPEFNALLQFFRQQEVTTLKGVFKDVPMSNPGAEYIMPYVFAEHVNHKKKILTDISIVFKNHIYVFGSGGIHSYFKGKRVEVENTDYVIKDADVKSYYVNLSIANDFKPAHLGEDFMITEKDMYNERQTYTKEDPRNTILKAALTSSYGLSNSEYSFIYDPLMTIQICLNGQLLITMLIEKVLLTLERAECLMANTDGATFKIHKNDEEEFIKICKDWEAFTKLELEYADYKSMYFRDVNSYVWIPSKEGKKPKVKGCFDDKPAMYKDHSSLVIQKALIAYFDKGTPFEEFITNHTDIYDFCKIVRAKGCKFYAEKYNKEGRLLRQKQGKVVRYYITNRNGNYNNIKLMKYLPPLKKKTYTELYKEKIPDQMDIFDIPEVEDDIQRKERISNVEANDFVKLFNTYEEKPFNQYNVNFDYYIKECKKIIKSIR